MKCARYLVAMWLLFAPTLAHAQDFGVMESAETIDRGNFKLKLNPVLIFFDGRSDTGLAAAFGYGFTDRFDAELKLAFYDGVAVIGGDAEFRLIRRRPLDLSVVAGFHLQRVDFSNQTGVDVSVIGSRAVTSRLDFYAALDLAFNRYTDVPNTSYTRAHLVPGIEYKVHRNLDLLFEVGVAVNDNGHHYVSGGVAYYLR